MSPSVADLATTAGVLAGDDALITRPEQALGDLEIMLVAYNQLQAAVVQRLSVAVTLDATTQLCGRATRSWLIEEQQRGRTEASRWMNLVAVLPSYDATRAAFTA